ncbi:very long chain fatty acid elongase 7-like isoform X1 [Procambarus clarkii]|uniref:very long chain fatty acid elongase 7-like isoform X1 n=1 Tax=Procambarus clarkii TaxID=6728 RepID=UPI003743F357
MTSEDVVTRRQASTRLPQQDEREVLRELKATGKLVAVMVILSYMYGDLTVSRQLTPDPRQHSWLLMTSPLPTIAACLLYVATVTWWGPRYMTSRNPLPNLRKVMMAYNAFQVVFSARIFWEAGMGGWFGSYSLLCQTCDFSDNPQAVRMVHAGYWYLFSKFVDFTDTVFFVLNKKNKHVSLLHVVHHALMPVCMWYGIRYYAGGHTTLMILLNAFVHTVMYSYYLLAAMGPRVRPFLWWKKYLTTLQIVQFTVVILQNLMVMFVECAIPSVLLAWVSGMALLFFILFTDFYIREYRKRIKHKTSLKGPGDHLAMVGLTVGPTGLPRGSSGVMYNGETNGRLPASSGSPNKACSTSCSSPMCSVLHKRREEGSSARSGGGKTSQVMPAERIITPASLFSN